MPLRYLDGFTTERAALDRSKTEAEDVRGCNKRPLFDVTKYWWAAIKHPDRKEWALAVEDGDEGGLDAPERDRLKDQATLDAGGWFPDVDIAAIN